MLPFESTAPGDPPTLCTRYRLRLEVEATFPYEDAQPLHDSRGILRFLWRHVFASEPREVVAVVFVDTQNRPIGHQIAFTGSLARCLAEPRHILASALLANAGGVILVHNHPSGDVAPSTEDLMVTRRLEVAGEAVGVRLLDSLILGRQGASFRWFSIARRHTSWDTTEPLTTGAHDAPPL